MSEAGFPIHGRGDGEVAPWGRGGGRGGGDCNRAAVRQLDEGDSGACGMDGLPRGLPGHRI